VEPWRRVMRANEVLRGIRTPDDHLNCNHEAQGVDAPNWLSTTHDIVYAVMRKVYANETSIGYYRNMDMFWGSTVVEIFPNMPGSS
jgi:hypothetical protein